MKSYRPAVIAALISTLALMSSYYYYQSSLTRLEYNEKRYRTTMNARSEKETYSARLSAFEQRWSSLGRLSKDKAANVSYEITLHPADFDELNEKIVSTYEYGFFFLKSAVLESTPDGIKLSVTGFKRGGTGQ